MKRCVTLSAHLPLPSVRNAVVVAALLVSVSCSKRNEQPDSEAGQSEGSQSGAHADAVGPTSTRLELPADLGKLAETATLTLRGMDVGTVMAELVAAGQGVAITIRVGTVLIPGKDTALPTLITAEPLTLEAVAEAQPRRRRVRVVQSRRDGLANLSADDTFTVAASQQISELLIRYLQHAHEQDVAWGIRQIGAWVIQSDVGAEEISKTTLSVRTSSIVGLGPATEAVLGAYTSFRQVEMLFRDLGVDVENYRLFRERRAMLADVLERLQTDQWRARNFHMLLNHRTLGRFDEPALERAFLAIVAKHPDSGTRQRALEALLTRGLSAPPAELHRTALSAPDRFERFLAAHALYKAGDSRMVPLLLCFDSEPALQKHVERGVLRDVVEAAGTSPNDGERAFDFWVRATNWGALPADAKTAAVKSSVLALRQEMAHTNPHRQEVIAKLESEDSAVVQDGIEQAWKTLNQDKDVFRRLSALALKSAVADTRTKARWAVSKFTCPGVKDLLLACYEGEADPGMRYKLLYDAHNGKFEGFGEIFRVGLGDDNTRNAATAASLVAQNGLKALTSDIAAAAARQADWKTFWRMAGALKRLEYARTPPLLVARLRARDARRRHEVAEAILRDWPEAAGAREAAVKALVALYDAETHPNTKPKYLSTLAQHEFSRALPLIERALPSSNGTMKRTLVRMLTRHGKGDARVARLLAPYRQDGDVGKDVREFLAERPQ